MAQTPALKIIISPTHRYAHSCSRHTVLLMLKETMARGSHYFWSFLFWMNVAVLERVTFLEREEVSGPINTRHLVSNIHSLKYLCIFCFNYIWTGGTIRYSNNHLENHRGCRRRAVSGSGYRWWTEPVAWRGLDRSFGCIHGRSWSSQSVCLNWKEPQTCPKAWGRWGLCLGRGRIMLRAKSRGEFRWWNPFKLRYGPSLGQEIEENSRKSKAVRFFEGGAWRFRQKFLRGAPLNQCLILTRGAKVHVFLRRLRKDLEIKVAGTDAPRPIVSFGHLNID